MNKFDYKKSYEYLLKILPKGITENDLEKYFIVDSIKVSSLEGIFERFIESAQNYQGMPNFIKFSENKNKIKKLLHYYDLNWIASQNLDNLFKIFYDNFRFKVSNHNLKFNSWYKWLHSVIDSAKFLITFKNYNDFKRFTAQFNYNVTTRTALPLLLSAKISGIGFALACDILKEIGNINYIKPDVHIIDICYELGLCDSKNPITVFETMIHIAEENKITPYKLDKILWLICSGNYYLDNKNDKSHKKDFINFMKNDLK